MKLDIRQILIAHFKSMHAGTSRFSLTFDIVAFYLIPLVCGTTLLINCTKIDSGFYGVSISAFAIFSALLLNTQVTIFSLYGKQKSKSTNQRDLQAESRANKIRDELIRELNTNVSYLMLLSVFSLFFSCLFYLFDFPHIEQFVVGFVYVHFAVMAIVVIKRSHALFDYEYRL